MIDFFMARRNLDAACPVLSLIPTRGAAKTSAAAPT